ncbi:MAG: hypothetical protein KAR54_02800 [Candidatus Pacebacteria bacterium]|nr:hypothetical protein [Candidatus Paceibacterota bacterium]
MLNFKNDNRGLISWIIIIVIAVIVLSYLGFDLRAIIEGEDTQSNLAYLWSLVLSVWNNYLATPVLYLWNDIFIDLLWNTFVENMDRIKAGQPTTIEDLTPTTY